MVNLLPHERQKREEDFPSRRRMVLTQVTLLLVGIILAISVLLTIQGRTGRVDAFVGSAVTALAATGATLAVMRYLSRSEERAASTAPKRSFREEYSRYQEFASIRGELARHEKAITGLAAGPQKQLQEGVALAKERITKEVADEIVGTVERRFEAQLKTRRDVAQLEDHFTKTRERLTAAMLEERSRAKLNLAFGVGVSVAAVGTLFGFVVALPTAGDLRYTAIFFAARLPVVVLIELFAFFFLRLYKTSLADIKYYQNELTNIELRLAPLAIAIARDDTEFIREASRPLSTTERNVLLQKDQSTVELERMKLERDVADDFREIFGKVIDRIPGRKGEREKI